MNTQTRDVLTAMRFAVKLLFSNGIVRADIRRDVPGVARQCGEPVEKSAGCSGSRRTPDVKNLLQIMQKCFLVMAAGQDLDVIYQGNAVYTVEVSDKRFSGV